MAIMIANSRQGRPLLLLATLLLAACASTGPAPVEDLNAGHGHATPRRAVEPRRSTEVSGSSHRVERGDTLYSIAFRNGVDYRDLAAWNRIGPPYTIFVGQELRLSAPASSSRARAVPPPSRVASSASPPPATSKMPVFEPVENTPPPLVNREATSTAPSSGAQTPAQTPSTKVEPVTTIAPTTAPEAKSTPPAESATTVGEVSWRWPATGTLVGAFVNDDKTRQGIDISGKSGDPVRAAADGTVVYSGNGLVGYGELIIIKHNASFLSAYGHNRKRMVAEGSKVKAGQVIAEMGSSSASRDSLHFEIRKNGKPVNPLDYLPRR